MRTGEPGSSMGDRSHLDLENSMPPQSVLAGLSSSHFSSVFTRLLAPSPRRGGRLAFRLPMPIVYDMRRQQRCLLLATHCLNGMRRTLVACGVTLRLIMLGGILQVLQGSVFFAHLGTDHATVEIRVGIIGHQADGS